MNEYQQLAGLIQQSSYTVVFTGAGMSTQSGIPDYRGPDGVWRHKKPIYFQEFLNSKAKRYEAWRSRIDELGPVLDQAKPNLAHQTLARWVRQGRVQSVITQNIDNLHQDSGIDNDKIIELHGNTTYATCLTCDKRYSIAEMKQRFSGEPSDEHQDLSVCMEPGCNGYIKTAVISFGQAMPEQAMKKASEQATQATLFLALGSSLSVQPAAMLPEMALYGPNPGHLVIINQGATHLSDRATLTIERDIGEALNITDQYL